MSLTGQTSWAKMTSLGGEANNTGVPPNKICKQSWVTNLSPYKHCYILGETSTLKTFLYKKTQKISNTVLSLKTFGSSWQANSTSVPPNQICKQSWVTNLSPYKHCYILGETFTLNAFLYKKMQKISNTVFEFENIWVLKC